MLRNFVCVGAGLPSVVESYAKLYAEARRSGAPCGQNDLWIGATAKAAEAVLLTCDKDFDWLDPHYLKVFRVDAND
jgi:predicted nuclease of predicted toxin-antitoxin system